MTITQAHQRKIKRLGEGHAPRLLDLFAGCGGISLGFEAAGFEIVGGVEIEPLALLMENVPDIISYGGHNLPAETCKVLN